MNQIFAEPTDQTCTPVPESLHVDTDALPFAVDFGAPGLDLKLLQADVEAGMFAVRISFAPGIQLPPHKHTGAVHAYTLSGSWVYLEYPDSPTNVLGSYLYEPPGSTHTLKVLDSNTGPTDVVFIIYGAMLIMDDAGNVTHVLDAQSHHEDWRMNLKNHNKKIPPFIQGGRAGYFPA